MYNRAKIQEILDIHSNKADQSSYDRETCILAILKASDKFMMIPDDVDVLAYL